MKRDERRKYPRGDVKFHVECSPNGETHSIRALSLGGGGLFLESSEHIDPYSQLKVRFRPAKHLSPIEAKARICHWVPGQGMGLEFTEISPEDREVILRFIHRRTVENRKDPRTPFVAQVQSDVETFLGLSRDISVGGMFIKTDVPFAEGSSLKLRFNLNDGGPIVIVTCEVRYVVKGIGIGLRFLDLLPQDRQRIANFVIHQESTTKVPP